MKTKQLERMTYFTEFVFLKSVFIVDYSESNGKIRTEREVVNIKKKFIKYFTYLYQIMYIGAPFLYIPCSKGPL